MRLESYEGDKYFIGTNLETKEKMKIHLMDIEQKNATKQKRRPELADFREPSNKNLYAEPGKAIMLFESCYPDRNEPGVYVSRWASRISSDPKETQIVIADASLIFGKKKLRFFIKKVRCARGRRPPSSEFLSSFLHAAVLAGILDHLAFVAAHEHQNVLKIR